MASGNFSLDIMFLSYSSFLSICSLTVSCLKSSIPNLSFIFVFSLSYFLSISFLDLLFTWFWTLFLSLIFSSASLPESLDFYLFEFLILFLILLLSLLFLLILSLRFFFFILLVHPLQKLLHIHQSTPITNPSDKIIKIKVSIAPSSTNNQS